MHSKKQSPLPPPMLEHWQLPTNPRGVAMPPFASYLDLFGSQRPGCA
jgi:hypothetical protein